MKQIIAILLCIINLMNSEPKIEPPQKIQFKNDFDEIIQEAMKIATASERTLSLEDIILANAKEIPIKIEVKKEDKDEDLYIKKINSDGTIYFTETKESNNNLTTVDDIIREDDKIISEQKSNIEHSKTNNLSLDNSTKKEDDKENIFTFFVNFKNYYETSTVKYEVTNDSNKDYPSDSVNEEKENGIQLNKYNPIKYDFHISKQNSGIKNYTIKFYTVILILTILKFNYF
uniref:Uncharacterized protein n=1 Tax=Parastrongyloides trichosuri TaxID=131310 RepID=A0A0N4Z2A2_PARTI